MNSVFHHLNKDGSIAMYWTHGAHYNILKDIWLYNLTNGLSHKIVVKLSFHLAIWQVIWQASCPYACQVSKHSNHFITIYLTI